MMKSENNYEAPKANIQETQGNKSDKISTTYN